MQENWPAIRPAVPDVFIIALRNVGDPRAANSYQPVSAGFRPMELGADAVYFSTSTRCVGAIAREYIPAIGHIG